MTKPNTATSTKSPSVPSAKVVKIKPADAKPADGEKAKKAPNKLTHAKMQRVLGASTKRALRLAAFFDPKSEIAQALTHAAAAFALATKEAAQLPADWKPIRSNTARAFAALTQGGKCRIAKGLVEKYLVLLDDEDGDSVEEKTAALSELLIVKLGEKNSVVRTANGTKFAISTNHLRTV